MAKNPGITKEVAGGDMENDREAGMSRTELKPEDGCSTRPHAPEDKPNTAEQVAFEKKRTLLHQRFEEFARRDREELAIARSEGEKPVQETQADHRKAKLCGTNKQLQNLVSRARRQNHDVQNKSMETLDLLREHLDPPPDYKPFPSLAHERC